MSFVSVVPDVVGASATQLAGVGAAITQARAAAAAPTTGMLAAAQDEVSVGIAALFSEHAAQCQLLGARAAVFHQEFVRALSAGAVSYAGTEAASANLLQVAEQNVLAAVNAPFLAQFGRPLIGNGANAAPGSGQNGGA
ncbi:PE family protein, partial [Mycobacterium helveticum]